MLLNEDKLKAKDRNKLPDSEFGIPSHRRFPLNDRARVLAAIRMFSYVDKEHEAELAHNIIRKMKEYNIPMTVVSEKNRLYKYIHKESDIGSLKEDSFVPIQENAEIIEYINSFVINEAHTNKNYKLKGLNASNNNSPTLEDKIKAAKTISAIMAKLIIGHFITIFVDTKLSEFAIRTIRKNQRNKKLFNFINNEIEKVYKNHPDYKPCSAEQFKKTSIYDYFMSDWRDKTAKEKAKILGYASIDNAITVIVKKSIPLPGSAVLAIPVKMLLTYCGFNLGIGSVYNIALEINGETIAFGIDYRPIGFILSNLILYTFKDNKLIATRLKNPPESLYKITVDDAKKIIEKYGADDNFDKLKKDIQKINSDSKYNIATNIKKINEDYLNWYYDYIFNEVDERTSNSKPDSFLEWKQKLVRELKNNLDQFTQYAVKQTTNDVPFLQQNIAIIKNNKKFPVKTENILKDAPNYTTALQRLNAPLSTHLNGMDISKVEIDNSNDPNVNIPIKKSLIPTYTGKNDFVTYAKNYYYGSDVNFFNYSPAQISMIMQTAYQFCLGYQTKVRTLQTDLNGIINYISQDVNGMPNQQDMNAEINNQQIQNQTPAAQGMASTNPSANANKIINAATEYELFMEEYFGHDWESLLEDDMKSVPTKSMVSTPEQKQNNETNKPSLTSPNGTPVKVDQAALLKKQKQVVCEIIKDAFNAKMTAMGMIYRDFMLLMRRHVASYRGAEAANQGNENINQGGM